MLNESERIDRCHKSSQFYKTIRFKKKDHLILHAIQR